MTFQFLFFDTVDSAFGRVDRESLPQQALMEMVIQGITNKEDICCNVVEPKDVEEWIGVPIEDGEVVEIEWINYDLEGSVHLAWLPSSGRIFAAINNLLTGTVDWAFLPTSMEILDLALNAFTGSICLERLPEIMVYLNVSENAFCGSLKLESLPDTLTEFNACDNQFFANPTKGHLSVVGWTSTPVLGEAKNLFKPLVVFLSWRRPY
ncbi:hypothetical protein XU18_0855 [Perkinsela sp. CCAP 1560/4]|nr:hypothetical protein XU18_0855 [Perkinsela sp. CCAP 1560/4]|eukprot:KNH08658.1 hypothetical protein XU18_0855 [Perkinsela sp. CCAP 1560/4]